MKSKWFFFLCISLALNLNAQSVRDSVKSTDAEISLFKLQVRYGMLSNGLKYYIHNNNREDKVHMRLVVKAGENQVDNDQFEYAHLLEHMAFVKTEHFENAFEYFGRKGLKPSAGISAGTGADNTVYWLNMPSGNSTLIQDGFLWLRDCAQGIILNEARTDMERNVVIEEIRSSDNYESNLEIQINRFLKPGNYSFNRLATERMQSMKHYKFNRLLDFYRDWYRPDLQAVIVSGKVNVDSAEQQINALFSGLKIPNVEVKNEVASCQLLQEKSFRVFINAYAEKIEFRFSSMRQDQPEESLDPLKWMLLNKLSNMVMQNRLKRLQSFNKHEFTLLHQSYDASTLTTLLVSVDSIKKNVQNAVVEIERILRHGLSKEELNIGKEVVLKKYKEQKTVDSGTMVEDLMGLFLNETPLPDKKAIREFVESIGVKDIQNVLKKWIDMDNQLVIVIAPEFAEQKLLSQSVLSDWIYEARSKNINPFVFENTNVYGIQIMDTTGLTVTKTSETVVTEIGVTKLLLSNGIQVLLKPLTSVASENRVHLLALKQGGTLSVNESDISALRYGVRVVSASGPGKLSSSELTSFLGNRSVQVTPYLDGAELGFWGQSSSRELETMLQLINQYFNAPKGDADIFNDLMLQARKTEDKTGNPRSQFYDAISRSIQSPMDDRKDLESLTLQRAYDSYKKYFGNPSEFVFVFSGDFDVDKVKILVAKYFGNLPVEKKYRTSLKKNKLIETKPSTSSSISKTIYDTRGTKAEVQLLISGGETYNSKNNLMLDALGEALQSVLWTRLRETDGNVYIVIATFGFLKDVNKYQFSVSFSCDPEKVSKAVLSVKDEIEKLKDHGVSNDICEKVIAREKSKQTEQLNDPGFWSPYLTHQMVDNADLTEITRYENWIKEITPGVIQEIAKKYLNKTKLDKFVLMPKQYDLTK
jgi:zinc protease